MARACGTSSATSTTQATSLMTIPAIISHYNQNGYRLLRIEHQMYSLRDTKGLLMGYTPYIIGNNGVPVKLWCCGTLPANLTFAHVQTPYTSPNSHQWWMPHNSAFVNKGLGILANANFVGFTGDFEDLYKYAESLHITKGRLLLYDLTLRIGACLGIYPKDYVYLHRGSLAGATILHQKGCINLPNPCGFRVPISVFAGIFSGISSMDIENILCIYNKQFAKIP